MKALSTLTVLPETRQQQHAFANKAIEELMNGDYDLVKMWMQFTIIADTLDEIKKSETFRQAVVSRLAMYGKEGAEINGCTITLSERKNFDFSNCNHQALNESKLAIEFHKAKIKEIETFLKALKVPVADTETGDVIEPPTYTVTEIVTVR
jgi:hypothetical protein